MNQVNDRFSFDVGQLLHGTTLEISHQIEDVGLIPSRGAFIEEMYGLTDDNTVGQLGVFFSNPNDLDGIWGAVNAMRAAVARSLGIGWHDVTLDEISIHGAMIVVTPRLHDVFKLEEDGYSTSLAGYTTDVHPPCGAEPSDYYSFDFQKATRIISGSDLVDLVREVRRYGDDGTYMFHQSSFVNQVCSG